MPLPPADASSRAQRAQRDMVLREVSAMLDLDHPSVLQLREYFVQAGKAYLILEMLRGEK
jgi:calcium/calmodulin-dependent protein kinase I